MIQVKVLDGLPTDIDIIILSYAKDEELKALTEQTIETLLASEDPAEIHFNIVVIESNRQLNNYQFPRTKTIYPTEKFGYNRYANIGLKAGNSPYACICNNDLVFYKGWASAILKQMDLDKDLQSVSPYCEITHTSSIPDDGGNVVSTTNGILIGWCIFFKRAILDTIGYFDEHFEFWFADNDYGNTLAKYNIKHALVTSSKVTHLGSKTHATLSDKDLFEKTYGQFLYFDAKWNKRAFLATWFKGLLMPVFRYFFIKRNAHGLYPFSFRVISKLYGGIR